ncbi:glutamyl aminopeptidase isoform X2 [Nematostella vectensis]|uniref:glutamyl aminopeptidase isoform X2 n=1 Tax=Nematostella vectensis TaxID=45351 RepID=UPI0020771C7B|nr:glutamyl aminopeptidase isoform X2 [Nematostella vectensis]
MPSAQGTLAENIPLEGSAMDQIQFKRRFGTRTWIFIGAVVAVVVLLVLVIVLGALLGHTIAKLREVRESQITPTTSTPIGTKAPSPTTPGTEVWWRPRLPGDVIPTHYNINLNITVDQPHFHGRVNMFANVTRATSVLLLHSSKEMIFKRSAVWMVASTPEERQIKNSFYFDKNEYYVLEMADTLKEGRYRVELVYDAPFQILPYGLYRSSFERPNGSKSYFAATQFERSDARKAFPCLDEPALKATFNVTIAHHARYVALCNMPISSSTRVDNQIVDQYYQTSVVMPTYLLAFVVGEFWNRESRSRNNILMRYYARPSVVNHTEYAESVGGKIMTYFEDTFGVNYSLPKADQVAIPYFGPGAMENWGLILYAEDYLLWDADSNTEQNKQLVTSVIVHELVHQWFGNIVTLKWWNDMWLNEGFAKFFEYKAKAVVEPVWKKHEDFVSGPMSTAMTFDAGDTTNPIRVADDAPKEVTNSMSPLIYYDKAACVLRMLEDLLGEDVFLAGLKRYLKMFAFANAVTDDLWRALEMETCARGVCVQVKKYMNSWVSQEGYPVVTMQRENNTHYQFSQSRFLIHSTTTNSSRRQADYKWTIPLTYIKSGEPIRMIQDMSATTDYVKWDGIGWFKANVGTKGFYIVNYDDKNWNALAEQLLANHTVLSAADRAGLLMDAFNLARGARLNYTKAFGMTSYLNKETDYVPWEVALSKLNEFRTIVPAASEIYQLVMQYLVNQTSNQYEALGFQDTGDATNKFTRGEILAIQCRAEVTSCVTKAKELFRNWLNKGAHIPPNFRPLM